MGSGLGSTAATARTARRIIGSPPSSCRTLARCECMRVPLPAARMIAATALLFVVIEIRHFPGIGVFARRDQPVAIEGAALGYVDSRTKQELDVVGRVALGSELVVHYGLPRVGVDSLIA